MTTGIGGIRIQLRSRWHAWGERRRAGRDRRVCVVGPSPHFLSGMTYHTYALCDALAETRPTTAILLRRLIPRRWYPGAGRVGEDISHLRLSRGVERYDGVDWFWLPSLLGAIWFLVRRPPRTMVVQWWTSAVLHTEVVLALVARALGASVVVELHEVQDTGEARLGWVRRYTDLVAPLLFRRADRFVVHSEFDRAEVAARYGIPTDRAVLIPLPAWDHYAVGHPPAPRREDGVCHLLSFGIIRPFKGVEDLVAAFDRIPDDRIDGFHLTVVGETWEGWTEPVERIEQARHRDHITLVNRYVRDEEVDQHFGAADVVVLPYHRSSTSGPLQVAMGYGLPVIVSRVGGLVEAVRGYEGAVLVPPRDPDALLAAILDAPALAGRRFAPPRDHQATADGWDRMLRDLEHPPGQVSQLAVRQVPAAGRVRAGSGGNDGR